MNIIAFDTAAETCSLGLSVTRKKDDKRLVERFYLQVVTGEAKHSELIMDGVTTLLSIAGLDRTQLEGAACMEGPGSFTGLRIGFAAAKGIALALGVPVLPVPTLDCMALPFSFWPGIVLPLLDAKKASFFTALYREGGRLSPYLDIGLTELIAAIHKTIKASPGGMRAWGKILLTGPAAPMAFSALAEAFPGASLDPAHARGHAAELLNLAEERAILNKGTASSTGPLYLRKSDAELGK